jgi:hypothetical protein
LQENSKQKVVSKMRMSRNSNQEEDADKNCAVQNSKKQECVYSASWFKSASCDANKRQETGFAVAFFCFSNSLNS